MKPVCDLVVQSQVEGSTVANVLNRLDPFAYSGVTAVVDRTQWLTGTLWWIARIVGGTPELYYNVYWLQKHQLLPPRRHACLMRYGIAAAQAELDSVDRRITQEDHVRRVREAAEAKARARAEDQRARGVDAANTQSAVLKKKNADDESPRPGGPAGSGSGASSKAKAGAFQYIDFGPNGLWEAVKDKVR